MDKLFASDPLLLPHLLEVVHGPVPPRVPGALLPPRRRRRRVLCGIDTVAKRSHEDAIAATTSSQVHFHAASGPSLVNQLAEQAKILFADDPGATLDDLRESVTTLEEIERTARRVLGGAHPLTAGIEATLRRARVILQAREAGDCLSKS